MSQLRSKLAAGLTIVALGGLAWVALSHPQAPPSATQAQSSGTSVHQAAPPATVIDDEDGGADD